MFFDSPRAEALALTRHGGGRFDAGVARLDEAGANGNRAKIREAAQEFESVFLGEMLRPVFDQLETDDLFGGGSGERMYRSLLVQEYGRAIARTGAVGVAEAVEREMLKLQEVEQ